MAETDTRRIERLLQELIRTLTQTNRELRNIANEIKRQ